MHLLWRVSEAYLAIGLFFGLCVAIPMGKAEAQRKGIKSEYVETIGHFLYCLFGWMAYVTTVLYRAIWNSRRPNPIIGLEATPDDDGYCLVTRSGRRIPFGAAWKHSEFRGSARLDPEYALLVIRPTNSQLLAPPDFPDLGFPIRTQLKAPVCALVMTKTGLGYWVVSEAGQVFAYGDATDFGYLAFPELYGISWQLRWVREPFGLAFAPVPKVVTRPEPAAAVDSASDPASATTTAGQPA